MADIIRHIYINNISLINIYVYQHVHRDCIPQDVQVDLIFFYRGDNLLFTWLSPWMELRAIVWNMCGRESEFLKIIFCHNKYVKK